MAQQASGNLESRYRVEHSESNGNGEMEVITCGLRTFYVYRDHIYTRKDVVNGVTYLTCYKKQLCNGSLRFSELRFPTIGLLHSHRPDLSQIRKRRLKARLIARSAAELIPLKQIYETEILNFPEGAVHLGYPAARRSMHRAAVASFPQKPETLLQLQLLLTDPAWDEWKKAYNSNADFFKSTVIAPDGSQLALCIGEEFLPSLTTAGITLMTDATFKTVPRACGAVQLLTVHVVISDDDRPEVYPCAYILMSSKTQIAYECAFETLSRLSGGMQPGRIICDFEIPLRQALRVVFVGVDLDGCWFHHSQAVYLESQEYGLRPILQESPEANTALRQLMALPLLPSDENVMSEALNMIENSLRQHNLFRAFENFLTYYRTQWFQRVPPADWSVYRQNIRTNNVVERFNLSLLASAGQARHPEFWPFYNTLRRMHHGYVIKRLQRLNNENVHLNRRRRTYDTFNQNLRDMWSQWERGQLNLHDFLRRAGHMCAGIQRRLRQRFQRNDEQRANATGERNNLPPVVHNNANQGNNVHQNVHNAENALAEEALQLIAQAFLQ